jgi:hypothetical protein
MIVSLRLSQGVWQGVLSMCFPFRQATSGCGGQYRGVQNSEFPEFAPHTSNLVPALCKLSVVSTQELYHFFVLNLITIIAIRKPPDRPRRRDAFKIL